ncbi:MAG: hypothetical protein HY341_00795 [Candidatus Kerfeldbacteria bacterium]|nr:hypothetical protein [Candidatus Kerfeldbacteria bacterium]
MRRLIVFVIAAVLLELLAMEIGMTPLPAMAGRFAGIAAAAFVLVALWEKSKPDERDRMVTWRSSHIAFLAVSAVLTGVLLSQTFAHAVEPWTVIAIGALIGGKIVGRIISERQS